MRKYYSFFITLFICTACTVQPVEPPKSKVIYLSLLLDSLDSQSNTAESMALSRDIFKKTNQLTKEFQLTSPPLWHNLLVNMGIRQKGLCFHWSDALYLYLKRQHYRGFSFHLVGANIGSYFREHNALVITSKKEKIQEGVLIDPWRNSGELYFSKIENDTTYRWTHRVDRGCK